VVALSGEGPYPLHHMRDVQITKQTLQIPLRHFEGLLDHKLSSYPEPVKGIILHDEALLLNEGAAVRLLEHDEGEGTDTGWEVEATIKSTKQIHFSKLKTMSDTQARRYGYTTADELFGDVSSWFADKKRKKSDPENKVHLVDFSDIDPFHPQKGTTFFNPRVQKMSAGEGYEGGGGTFIKPFAALSR